MIKAVLFDLDGTLMDTSEGVLNSVRETITILGYPMPDEETLRSFIGPPIYESFGKTYGIGQEEVHKATELFRSTYKDKHLFEAVPYDGIFELLDSLKRRGFKIAVATNKRYDYTEKLLRHFDMYDIFDRVEGSDFANTMKKPQIIGKCLDELQTAACESIMIGDTCNDGSAANALGLDFIAVTYGFGFKCSEDAEKHRCVAVCDSVRDIEKYIIGNRE